MRTQGLIMPTIKLTRRSVDEIDFPKQGQVFYRDALLRGFGVRVGAASKVFIAEGQVNHRTRRVTIGRADVLSPEVARKRALQILGEMSEGIDPSAVKRRLAQELTVQAAFDAFFEAKTALAASSVDLYRRSIDLYLRDWKTRKLTSISRSMVLTRHRVISQERGAVTANNVFRHFRSVYNFTGVRHLSATSRRTPANRWLPKDSTERCAHEPGKRYETANFIAAFAVPFVAGRSRSKRRLQRVQHA